MAHRTNVIWTCAALVIALAPVLTEACDDPPNHYPAPCRVAYGEFAPFFAVAEEKGFFVANHVTVSVDRVPAADRGARLAAGSDTIGYLSGAEAIHLVLAGAGIKIIAAPINSVRLDLWTRRDIWTRRVIAAGALAGRTVALSTAGSGSGLAFATVLRDAGVDPGKVNTRHAPAAQRLQELTQGAVDAALFPSHLEADLTKRGFVRLSVGRPMTLAQEVIAVPDSLFKDDRNDKLLVQFLKSVAESIEFMKADKPRTFEIIRKRGMVSDDAVETVYARYAAATLTADIAPGVRAVIDDMLATLPKEQANLRAIKIDDVVVSKFVRRLR